MARKETTHGVAIVVDPTFGDKLVGLAARLHVWITDTAENKAAAHVVWRESGGVHSLERGVTTFSVGPTDRPDEIVASVLETIDLHHGEYSHSPTWTVLEVYGANPTPSLSAVLAERGFTNIAPTPDGFTASRSTREAGQGAC